MRIAFICSGNICRSPMAEAIARQIIQEKGMEAEVSSAGTLEIEGVPAATNAILALQSIGLDLRAHRSKGVTPTYLREQNAIVVMAETHADVVTRLAPASERRLHRLWKHTGQNEPLEEIEDPVGRDLDAFVRCRETLRECIENWLEKLPVK